jgi:hypothetical protein
MMPKTGIGAPTIIVITKEGSKTNSDAKEEVIPKFLRRHVPGTAWIQ